MPALFLCENNTFCILITFGLNQFHNKNLAAIEFNHVQTFVQIICKTINSQTI